MRDDLPVVFCYVRWLNFKAMGKILLEVESVKVLPWTSVGPEFQLSPLTDIYPLSKVCILL